MTDEAVAAAQAAAEERRDAGAGPLQLALSRKPAATLNPMRRFFKTRAFPILWWCSPSSRSGSSRRAEGEGQLLGLLTQLDHGQIKRVELRQKTARPRSRRADDKKYESVPRRRVASSSRGSSLGQGRGKIQEFDIKGRKTNGWVSALTYLLPFLLFIGLWIFLMNSCRAAARRSCSSASPRPSG
jgi:ATP-dependent Zn protease